MRQKCSVGKYLTVTQKLEKNWQKVVTCLLIWKPLTSADRQASTWRWKSAKSWELCPTLSSNSLTIVDRVTGPSSQLWLRNTFPHLRIRISSGENWNLPRTRIKLLPIVFVDTVFDVQNDANTVNFSLLSDLPGPVFIALSFLSARQRKSYTGRGIPFCRWSIFCRVMSNETA